MKKILEKKNLPKVFIIVLNHNGGAFLKETLSDVFRLEYADLEVVLVDNASVDGSLESVRGAFSRVILIKNSENVGVSAGMNVGITYALEREAEYVFLLKAGWGLSRNSVASLVEKMKRDTTIGLGSPMNLNNEGQSMPSGGKINWLKMRLEHEKKREGDYFGLAYLCNWAMLVRAEMFRKIGLLNKDYFMYWGDADFSARVRAAGYKLLISSESQAVFLPENHSAVKEEAYWKELARILFFKKNTPAPLWLWAAIFFGVRWMKNMVELYFSQKNKQEIKTKQKAYQDFYSKEGIF